MNPIFYPSLNFFVRHLMKPIARWLPEQAHPRVTGTIRVEITKGQNIFLHCNPTSFLSKRLFFRGVAGWEPNAASVLMRLFRRSALFLDVGANIGYYTLLAKACQPALRVLSVEPAPDAFLYLEKNVRLNRFRGVRCVRKALSEAPGTATFHLAVDPVFKELRHQLTATAGLDERVSARSPIMRTFEVETGTVDRLVEEQFPGEQVDLIKLDTEASEHRVLHGAGQVLSRHRPVLLCEVLPDTIGAELEVLFREHDYRALRICADGLEEVRRLGGHAFEEKEHLVVPAERCAEVRDWLAGGDQRRPRGFWAG